MAAYEENMNPWSVIRWLLGVSCVCILVRITIADFPSGMSWWGILIEDRSGLIHELWYTGMWFWFAMTSTYLWQLLGLMIEREKRLKVYRIVRKV